MFFRSFSLDGKGTKRSSRHFSQLSFTAIKESCKEKWLLRRHECRPLCPPSDSVGKSKLDAYALLHAAVGGLQFTPLPYRMSAWPTHISPWHESALWVCSPSGLQGLVEQVGRHVIPLLLEGVPGGRGSGIELLPSIHTASAPHVGMAHAHIVMARVCLVGMQSVRTAGLGRNGFHVYMFRRP